VGCRSLRRWDGRCQTDRSASGNPRRMVVSGPCHVRSDATGGNVPRGQDFFTRTFFRRGKVIHRRLRGAVPGSPPPRMNNFGNRISGLSCGAGCPACRIADSPSARRVKNKALPCSPRAWFPSSPRRLGSLRYSRQGCLRYQDNPVTDNLWQSRGIPPFSLSPREALVGREPERGAFSARPSSVLSPLILRRERKKFLRDRDLGDSAKSLFEPDGLNW